MLFQKFKSNMTASDFKHRKHVKNIKTYIIVNVKLPVQNNFVNFSNFVRTIRSGFNIEITQMNVKV